MWKEIWEQHKGKITGIAAGFILGVIYLIWGFWDMLVFAFLSGVGFYYGRKVDRREKIASPAEILQWLMERLNQYK